MSPPERNRRTGSRHSSLSPPVANSTASSISEDSYAAATAAAEAAEAADVAYGVHGENYGGEYYSDYANNNYYYNYYYRGANSTADHGHGDDSDGEPEDGHELYAMLAPPRIEEGPEYDEEETDGQANRDSQDSKDVSEDDDDDDDEEEAEEDDEEDDDEEDSDDDSTKLQGEYEASVTSSIRAHVYEGGMRYHAYQGTGSRTNDDGTTTLQRGKLYALPNDETEQNRDDMKHAMTLLLMRGQPFYAPVHERLAEGGQVYDLGTGTGIWAVELADKYPNTIVQGVDLSPIQPNFVPSNVFFTVDDFEDEWVYPPNAFDFIHMRHSLFAVEDRPALLRRIFRHLKPGGFVEFQEMQPFVHCDDDTLPPGAPYALRDFVRYVGEGMRQSPVLGGGSLLLNNAPTGGGELPLVLSAELQRTGFQNVRAATHKCPLGVWPRDRRLRGCGLLMRTALMDGLRGLACRPLGSSAGGLGWSTMQIEVFLVDVRKAVMDPTLHVYFPLHVVYAQKPEDAG